VDLLALALVRLISPLHVSSLIGQRRWMNAHGHKVKDSSIPPAAPGTRRAAKYTSPLCARQSSQSPAQRGKTAHRSPVLAPVRGCTRRAYRAVTLQAYTGCCGHCGKLPTAAQLRTGTVHRPVESPHAPGRLERTQSGAAGRLRTLRAPSLRLRHGRRGQLTMHRPEWVRLTRGSSAECPAVPLPGPTAPQSCLRGAWEPAGLSCAASARRSPSPATTAESAVC
jgi:hypothetical protein